MLGWIIVLLEDFPHASTFACTLHRTTDSFESAEMTNAAPRLAKPYSRLLRGKILPADIPVLYIPRVRISGLSAADNHSVATLMHSTVPHHGPTLNHRNTRDTLSIFFRFDTVLDLSLLYLSNVVYWV